ncbi:hypothetical protein [Lyngbya confervoides]|uniref:Secreted protein n=1 Tax=Lyngbya confervoides BDU141951 TaxID=1574623 RepID=A0ABD4T328_9CYAN|nr:hypothetical protein [Lyngbya confervoides]MCM1982796.1 hypothetical protein [Lyngbya confervoides BDU141951]
MARRRGAYLMSLGVSLLLGQTLPGNRAIAAVSSCPRPFEEMVTQLLADLPAYANRVNTRTHRPQTYVMLATNPDFQPLSWGQRLSDPEDSAADPAEPPQDSSLRQVFFTTVLRRYSGNQISHHQEHHWLFVASSSRGWEFVQIYSILDAYPSAQAPSPPRNSSRGSLAIAIQDWLKFCRLSWRSHG